MKKQKLKWVRTKSNRVSYSHDNGVLEGYCTRAFRAKWNRLNKGSGAIKLKSVDGAIAIVMPVSDVEAWNELRAYRALILRMAREKLAVLRNA